MQAELLIISGNKVYINMYSNINLHVVPVQKFFPGKHIVARRNCNFIVHDFLNELPRLHDLVGVNPQLTDGSLFKLVNVVLDQLAETKITDESSPLMNVYEYIIEIGRAHV